MVVCTATEIVMAQAQVIKTLAAPAQDVWEQLSDFSGIAPGGPIEAVSYSGEGVGMVRTLTMAGGEVVERLESWDGAERRFSYAITNNDSPLPFADYSASVHVADNGDGTSTVTWTGNFEPKGVDEATAINTATGIYAGGIKGARIALNLD